MINRVKDLDKLKKYGLSESEIAELRGIKSEGS